MASSSHPEIQEALTHIEDYIDIHSNMSPLSSAQRPYFTPLKRRILTNLRLVADAEISGNEEEQVDVLKRVSGLLQRLDCLGNMLFDVNAAAVLGAIFQDRLCALNGIWDEEDG